MNDDLKENLEKVIKHIKPVEEVSDEHNLKEDFEFDSLDLISFFFELEKVFNIKIENEDLEDDKLLLVHKLVEYVRQKMK